MKNACLFIALALLAACNSEPTTSKPAPEEQPNTASADSLMHCYQYANQGDTVTMKLIHMGDIVTGTLIYQLKEKDSNKGSITGAIHNDVLVADYTFMSEGTQSVRQVAFKQSGTAFIEGYGESADENGVAKFKNLDSLHFNSSIKLQEMSCK